MYTVRWKRSAVDRLTDLWIEASDRPAVTSAVDEIDRILAADPLTAGESRSEQTRVVFISPIGVFVDIDESAQIVNVLKVWTF